MEKTNKLAKFTVKIEGNDYLCVKFLKDKNSSVSIKDTAIVNLLLSIKKIDRTLTEHHSKIEDAKIKAKEYLLKKEKQVSMNIN